MAILAGSATGLSTAPDPVRPVRSGPLAALRRAWRQLTSMRTALLLLFGLAVAAVPGSVLPQRGLNQLKVDDYFAAHPELAPVLDRLSLFDVFGAPWFAAIYLLLFVSLMGCLSARVPLHARALLRRPPAAPRHLDRLPHFASYRTKDDVEAAVVSVLSRLHRSRWRLERRDGQGGVVTLCAEKGYLRETGNLVFHVALVVLLAAVALGGLYGWNATVLVTEGEGFCNTVNSYDAFEPGRLVDGGDLPPFCVELDEFTADYQPGTALATSFSAAVRYGRGDGEPATKHQIEVNSPLRLDGARTYLLGHGFSPVVTVTDPSGQVFTAPIAFLPADDTLASTGAVKLPDARPRQIGIDGVFTPDRDPADRLGLKSLSPVPDNPALSIRIYTGDLGLDSGVPQSVFSLDERQIRLERLNLARLADSRPARVVLGPGQSVRLADGTTVRFDGYREWARMRVARDPGQLLALTAASGMVGGLVLSLRIRRRRVWFRFSPADPADPAAPAEKPGRTVVAVGGLARTDSDTFTAEFGQLTARAREG